MNREALNLASSVILCTSHPGRFLLQEISHGSCPWDARRTWRGHVCASTVERKWKKEEEMARRFPIWSIRHVQSGVALYTELPRSFPFYSTGAHSFCLLAIRLSFLLPLLESFSILSFFCETTDRFSGILFVLQHRCDPFSSIVRE